MYIPGKMDTLDCVPFFYFPSCTWADFHLFDCTMTVCMGCEQNFPCNDSVQFSKCVAWQPGLGTPEIKVLNVGFVVLELFR